jgi:hypothetical protein
MNSAPTVARRTIKNTNAMAVRERIAADIREQRATVKNIGSVLGRKSAQ